MYYQDIPFLIWSSEKEKGKKIARILGSRANTFISGGDTDSVKDFLNKIVYFTCNIFHVEDNLDVVDELIKLSLKLRPLSAVILFSEKQITEAHYRTFIRSGVADVLIPGKDRSPKEMQEELLRSLNHRWKLFRHVERERNKIYHATVVTAYHEINQPLTVMLNTIGLFNLEMEQDDFDRTKTEKLLKFILKSIKRIQDLLQEFQSIKEPVLKEYTKGVPMIHLPRKKDQMEDETQIVVKPHTTHSRG